jgi:hypothetical protein
MIKPSNKEFEKTVNLYEERYSVEKHRARNAKAIERFKEKSGEDYAEIERMIFYLIISIIIIVATGIYIETL